MGRFTEKYLQREPDDVQEMEAKKDEDNFQADVIKDLDLARKCLADYYGVTDMTTAEGVQLRHIIADCVKRRNDDMKLVRAGELTGIWIAPPAQEAMTRWFRELYGIDLHELATFKVKDRLAYIRRIREKSHEPGIM